MKKISISRLLFKTILTGFLFVSISLRLSAQTITNYTFATSTGTFTALTSPTNPTLSAGTVDDGSYDNIPIGFDFWYMGTKYTAISASTNGYFSFGASETTDFTNNLSGGGIPRPVIAPLWDDLDVQVATNVSYKVTGSAPTRVFTIQYLNAQWQYNATGNTMSFQVSLYEGTGKVEFIYRPEAGAQAAPTASIGITASATGSGNFLSVNNAGTSVSSTVEASVTTKPVSGKTYGFTPPVPTAPGSLTFTSIGTTAMTLNWSDLSSNETGFAIYKSTDGTNYSFISQTAAGATSSVQSGLTAGTTYYWKIYAVSEGGLSSALSGNQATTSLVLSDWLYRKAITIDYTKVGTGPHTNFPVLISRADTDLQTKAQADGDDILFIAADGITKLSHEIESYTSASGTLIAWVKIPSLSSSVNTVIYMYYGNASATSQQDVAGTWNSNFKGVWHLNSTFTDATSNGNNGTNTQTTNVAGKIANGSGFNPTNGDGADYITVTGLLGSPTSYTLSAWANLITIDPNAAEIISLGDYSVLRYDVSNGKVNGVGQVGAATWVTTTSTTNYATGWHYVVYTFDDAGNSQQVYIDGLANGAATTQAASPYYTGGGTNTFIGKHGNGNANMDFYGTIDEAHVSNSVRSAGWILTEYNNQNSPSTFYSVSMETVTKTFTGTGNFSDATKWTGSTLPVAGDNLIIDGACTVDNSGTTDNVAYGTLTIGTATGRTLNWAASGTNRLNVSNVSAGAGASTLSMTNGGTLIARGTWTSTNLTFTPGAGTIDIRSTMTLPAAYATYYNLTVNGSSTTVTAAVNSTVNNNLTVTSGTFTVGAFSLSVTGTATVTSTMTITSATGTKSFGNLVINSGGAFTNTSANVPITIAGNLQNDGTFSQGTGRVIFTGATSNTVAGIAATTAFGGGITVNKGVANTNVLDVQAVITLVNGGLTLTNGTFKLTSASTIIPFTADIGTAPYLVPSTAGLWCNGGTISPSATNWSVDGLLRVTSGVVTVGNAANHILGPKPNSLIIVEGGNLYVTGRVSNPTNPWTFNMTGGTMTINTMGTTTASRPPFYMDVTSCSFSMSGGTMVIERAGGTAGQNLGFHSIATSGTGFTGGTLQIGNGSTPAASTIGITSTKPIYNLTVNSANATAQLQTSALTVTNTVTISAGTLDANSLGLTVGGNWINNVSTTAFTGGSGTVTFNSTGTSIGGSFATTFNSLTMNRVSGSTLGANITAGGTLTFTSGNITTGSNSVYLNSTGTVSRTSGHVIGNFKKYIATGATSKTFEIGDASNYTPATIAFASVTTTGDLTASTATGDHANIGSSTISATNTANRTWTLTNSGILFTNYSPTFTFVAGDLDGGATTGNFSVGRYSAGWTYPTVGTKTSTSTQATGVTAFGDFQVGEICSPPTTSAAGADQTDAATCGLTTVNLAANTPSVGTGAWSVISGVGGTVTTPTSATSIFSGTAGNTYTLRWTISNSPCIASTDDVVITFTAIPAAPTVTSPVNYCQNVTAAQLTATGSNLMWNTGTTSGSVGGTTTLTTTTFIDGQFGPSSIRTNFATTAANITITTVDYYIPAYQSTTGLVLSLYNSAGTAIATSSTSSTQTAGGTAITVTNTFNYVITTAGDYSIRASAGYGNIGGDSPTFPITEATGAINVTGSSGLNRTFNDIQFSRSGSSTAPTPVTTAVGTVNYTVNQTVSGCNSPDATIAVIVSSPPTASAAGADQTSAATCGLTTVTLAANAPSIGTGAWSIISGAGGTVTTPTSATSTFTGTAGTAYVLRWTISNSPCTASTDDVAVTFNRNPTTSAAGADQTSAATCGLTTVTLAANAPSIGTGAWSIVSGTGGTVTTPTSATSTFSGIAGTAYVLRWTVSNSPCTASTDDVSITFNQNPTTSATGTDQTGSATCGLTTVTLAANAPSIGTGAWSIISGAGGTVTTPTSATSTFTGTAGTAYVLRWTISNAPCTASTDDVSITFNRNPTTSAAGADQTGSATCGLTTVTLAANAPSIGTGAWSIVSGAGGTVTTPTSATSTFTGTAGTAYVLRWTISNNPCTASTDDVVITFNQNPTTSAAGADQTGAATCGLTSITLAANAPSIGTGAWSIISGSGGTVTTPTSATSTFTGTAGTTYTLRWTISNNPCTASTDDVVITFTPNPSATISYAGSPYYVSGGTATITFAGTTGGTYSSTAGLTINASTGDVTLGTSTPATYTVTYTIAAAGGCSEYTTTASITVIVDVKTWDGGASTNNWGDAANWNADGVPTSSDNVDLTGAHTININVTAATNNLLLNNASLVLTVNSGNSLTVTGNLTLTSGTLNTANTFPIVTGTVNVAGGMVGFTGSGSQTILAYNYNNLTSSSTGSRTLAGGGTIGIAGTFTPGTNTYTNTGSTIDYNAAGVQTIAAFNYNNLTLSNSGIKTFATGTSGIASTLSITGSATANATTNSSVISYNGSANQTITALTYYGLNVSSTGATVTGINTTVTNFSINSGTVDLNTNTLTTTGTATYTSGTINNGIVTSTGTSTTFAGTSFGAIVNATSDNLNLNGSVFNNTVTLTKNGSTAIVNNGANTFNSTATIASSSSANFTLANTSPDIFNGTTVFTNTGTAALYIAYNSAGNLFNGNVTINNTGTGSSIRSSYGSLATATFSGNIVVNNTSTGGIHFGATGGTTTLAATKTITKGGTGFATGTLLMREFTQVGGTAQSLTLTGTALLQMGPSAIFNGNVNFISPQVLLNGSTFNGTASLTKNGSTNNVSTGGNIFSGVTTISNSSSGSFDLGNTSPDIFNADLTVNNTGPSRLQIGIGSVGNLFNGNTTINHGGNTASINTVIARNPGSTATFNGNLMLNCTNLNATSGIIVSNEGTVVINGNVTVSTTSGRGVLFSDVGGSVTLATGFTISDGGAGNFTTGILKLSRFTQTGATAQNIALTGTASLQFGPTSIFNGTVNLSAPQLILNGSQYNNTAVLTKNGATDNTWTGANIFNGATTIANSGTGFLRLSNAIADDFNSDATFIQTGSGLLQPAYGSNCTIAGNLSTAGTATAISFGTGTGTVTLDGTGAQSIGGSLSPTIRILIIANTGNTVTSGVNTSVTGNLSVTSGTFDLGSFTVNRLTAGGTLTVSNGATLKIGSTNTIPSNYTTHSVGATSTIEYSGTNQSVAVLNSSQDYGHLAVSGSGTKINSGNLTVGNNVTITAGTLDISTYTLKIGGSISNSGTFVADNGTIEMNGSSAQTIPAATFSGNALKGLTINNNAGVTLGGTINLTDVITVSNGSLASNGYLILKSSATATARVAPITSIAATPISGNVIAERYVPGRRKYRFITSPVTTSAVSVLTAGQESLSIWGNWQNSGINTNPLVGNYITGGSAADGFDQQTPNNSLFTYDAVNMKYVGYSTANGKNTKYTPLKAGVAYFMFVYGDRMNTITTSSPNNTVISATGTIKTGTQVYNTSSDIPLSGVTGRFTLVGNPFASPIDWALIAKTDIENSFWGWDPNLSSTGGYVTVTTLGGVTIVSPFSGSTGVNQYIQSGQGFFVKTAGPSPVLTIREQDKVPTFNGNTFRTYRTESEISLLAINLQYTSGSNKILADGVLAVFDPSYVSTVGAEDATEMPNLAENMSIVNGTSLLSIDARPLPGNSDTLYLNTSRLTKPQYTLQIFAQQMAGNGVQAYLQDRYLNTVQLLSLTDTNRIVINITAGVPASADINRFRIVFQSLLVSLPVTYTSVKATPKNKDIEVEWNVADETGILKYEIEKSTDGIVFDKGGEVTVTGNNSSATYQWLDVHPVTGNNYYRIRGLQADGKAFISKTAVAKIALGKINFKIYPNPIADFKINIRAGEMEKGKYTLIIHNQQGQQIILQEIYHKGGAFNQIIYLSTMLPGGVYYLQIESEQDKYRQKIFLE